MKSNAPVHEPKSPAKVKQRSYIKTALMLVFLLCLVVAGRAQAQECPELVSQTPIPGAAADVAISAHYAYVASSMSGLSILDIKDPSTPQLICNVSEYSNIPCELAAESQAISVNEHFAYISYACAIFRQYYVGFVIFDISDPFNPSEIGTYNTYGDAISLPILSNGSFVFQGWGSDGGNSYGAFKVFDVSNPAQPSEIGTYNVNGIPRDFLILDNFLFVLDGDYFSEGYGMLIYDLSDIYNLRLVGGQPLPGNAMRIAGAGNAMILCDSLNGIYFLDVTDKSAPIITDHVQDMDCYDVSIDKSYLCAVGLLKNSTNYIFRIYDVHNISTVASIATIVLGNNPKILPIKVNLHNRYAILGQTESLIAIYDISGCWKSPHKRPVTRP